MDAGYFDINYCQEINDFKGFYLIRASNRINPDVVEYTVDGEVCKIDFSTMEKGARTKLKELKFGKDKVVDYTVKWAKFKEVTFRVIEFWDRKCQRKGYLITNLPAEQFNALEILNLYGLRWQVELFFKELKSYCSFKKINTANENIVKSFIWASILTLMLKRFVAFSVALMNGVMISTQKVARSSLNWFPEFILFIFKEDLNQEGTLERIFKFLGKWATRAHPERDKKTILYQLAMQLYGCTTD